MHKVVGSMGMGMRSMGAMGRRPGGSIGVALPLGAVGAWYMDTYSATPRPNVPNAAAAGSADPNLFTGGRNVFASELWTKSSVVAVDALTTFSDGSGDASTLAITAPGLLKQGTSTQLLPAGTYTIAATVERNTGTDQSVCFTKDNLTSRSSVQTVGATVSNISYTFTLGSPTRIDFIALCSIDASTAANIKIRDLRLFAGSSDLGVTAQVGNLYLGQSGVDTRPAYAAGELDMSSTGIGLIQFPASVSLNSGFTMQAAIRQTAAGSGYQSILSKLQAYTQFSSAVSMNAAFYPPLHTTTNPFNSVPGGVGGTQGNGLWKFLNRGYHVLTLRHDGTKEEWFLDDIRMFVNVGSLSAVSVRDLFLNITNSITLYGGLKYSAIALWNRALSNAEILQGFQHFKARAARNSITINGDTANRILVSEGDSISATLTGFPQQFAANASPAVFGTVFGVSGSTLANVVTRAPYVDAVIPSAGVSGRKFILSLLIGANDLAGYAGASDAAAAASYLTDLAAYHDARRAAGFKTVACTLLPISGATTYNARRAIVNTGIRTWVGVHCDGVADFAADATMGTDTSFTDNPTKWTDGTHPNTAGHTILETIYRPVINGL